MYASTQLDGQEQQRSSDATGYQNTKQKDNQGTTSTNLSSCQHYKEPTRYKQSRQQELQRGGYAVHAAKRTPSTQLETKYSGLRVLTQINRKTTVLQLHKL